MKKNKVLYVIILVLLVMVFGYLTYLKFFYEDNVLSICRSRCHFGSDCYTWMLLHWQVLVGHECRSACSQCSFGGGD